MSMIIKGSLTGASHSQGERRAPQILTAKEQKPVHSKCLVLTSAPKIFGSCSPYKIYFISLSVFYSELKKRVDIYHESTFYCI